MLRDPCLVKTLQAVARDSWHVKGLKTLIRDAQGLCLAAWGEMQPCRRNRFLRFSGLLSRYNCAIFIGR